MKMMKAYAVVGGSFQVIEVERPVAQGRDVVVRVRGLATNPVDGKVRDGMLGPLGDTPRVLGWDASGTVDSVGPEAVGTWAVGDAVWFAGDVTRPGAFAEYVAVDSRAVARKPTSLDWADAAAMPLTALTAWEGLVEVAGLANGAGKSLLVIGGAGGVGSMVLQLAKRILQFDTVVATASRPETAEFCRSLGADHVVNHREPLAPQLAAIGLHSGVDVVFNTADPDHYVTLVADLLRPRGHLIVIESLKVAPPPSLFYKRVSLHFELMFSRLMLNDEPERQGRILADVAKWVDEGSLRCRVRPENRRLLKDLPAVVALQDSGSVIGKLVVDADDKAWHSLQ